MGESDPKNFLDELKKEKEIIENYIKQLEGSIIDNETKYLQNTVNSGNILRGWEHIFTAKSNKNYMGNQVKKTHISNNVRLFSQTFDFDKYTEELNNENEKHHHISQSVSMHTSNNNLKLEEDNNKNAESGNVNHVNGTANKVIINHKNKNFSRLKKKRNNINSENNQNDKQE